MGEVALRFLNGGFESTKGTGVAATRQIMGRITNPNFNIPRDFIEEDRGTLVASTRFVEGVKDYTFSIAQENGTTFEDIGWIFHTVVHGTAAPTTINTAAYSRTYTPQTTASGDTLKAATIEFGDDTQEFECEYCEGEGFNLGFATLAVGQAAPVTLTTDYITQSLASNTKTSLSAPTVETILATGATFSLGSDSTAYASLSAVTGSLRAYSMTYANNLGRKVYVGDGTTFSNVGRGRRVVTFTAQVEGNSAGVTRFTEWDLGTYKRMRLLFQGQVISGSSPATTQKLQIDGRFVLTEFDPIGEVDTNTTFQISGRYMPDTALSDAEVQFLLVNGVSAYT